MRVDIEYGDGSLSIDVPEKSHVIRAGVAFEEPPALPDAVVATREALRNPLGSKPIHELVDSRSRVVIGFPDRVKGGMHDTAHRRVAIGLILDELERAGVRDERIRLVCGIGLHRKNTMEEFAEYLGAETVRRFGPANLVNHDAEDPAGIVSLGETDLGDHADFNRSAFEADLTIMLGHTMGNPYGGYSGGYKMPCTGFTSWRSIRCHHSPPTMYRDDFVPTSTGSRFRDQLRGIGQKVERERGSPFFLVDAVLNGRAEQLHVAAGTPTEVEAATWPIAGTRTDVVLPGERANVLVLGIPRSFHYGPGMGSNPVLMLQSIGAWVTRASAALAPNFVVIAAAICDGWFNDTWFPAYRSIYEKLQELTSTDELMAFEEPFSTDPEWIHRYRHAYAYHPFHGFSMAYMGSIATRKALSVYVLGAKVPGYARGMGCVPVTSFEDAVTRAERVLGDRARMIVVPEVSKPAVHLRAQEA
ncbi:lactate racemase domain-containing protein [soil metagenome]